MTTDPAANAPVRADLGEGGVPPVVIVGMHRSGTSMLARHLESLGLFMGARLERNHEATSFVELNEWLLRRAGGAWDHPESVDELLNSAELRELTADYFRSVLSGPRVTRYTGVGRFVRGDRPLRASTHWGWKDPRNTFTLPVWLDIFPQSRVLHIYRNGIDVAHSLRTRAQGALVRARATHDARMRSRLYWARLKRTGFVNSVRCLNLASSFELWELYVARAFGYGDLGDRIMHVRFEDFLAQPLEQLASVSSFCGLTSDSSQLERVVETVRAERRFAFKDNPELVEFYATVRGSRWMEELGYASI